MGRQERVVPRGLVRRDVFVLHLQSHPVRVLLVFLPRVSIDSLVRRYHSHIRRRDSTSLSTLRLARDCLKVRRTLISIGSETDSSANSASSSPTANATCAPRSPKSSTCSTTPPAPSHDGLPKLLRGCRRRRAGRRRSRRSTRRRESGRGTRRRLSARLHLLTVVRVCIGSKTGTCGTRRTEVTLSPTAASTTRPA